MLFYNFFYHFWKVIVICLKKIIFSIKSIYLYVTFFYNIYFPFIGFERLKDIDKNKKEFFFLFN